MNAANWMSVGLQLFECSDHGVNFLYKSVYCSLFYSFRWTFSVTQVLWNWSLHSELLKYILVKCVEGFMLMN